MQNIDKSTPVWQLTVEELVYCIKQSLPPQDFSSTNVDEIRKEDYIKGLRELADFLGISYSQVWRLKNKGIFDKAIKQRDRTIIIHKKTALELFNDEDLK